MLSAPASGRKPESGAISWSVGKTAGVAYGKAAFGKHAGREGRDGIAVGGRTAIPEQV